MTPNTQHCDDVQLWLEYWQQVRAKEAAAVAAAAQPARSFQPHPDEDEVDGDLRSYADECVRFRGLLNFIFVDPSPTLRFDPLEALFITRLLAHCAYLNTRVVLCSGRRAQEALRRGEDTVRRIKMGHTVNQLFSIEIGSGGLAPTRYILRDKYAAQFRISGTTAQELL